jgi:hypothetical protein
MQTPPPPPSYRRSMDTIPDHRTQCSVRDYSEPQRRARAVPCLVVGLLALLDLRADVREVGRQALQQHLPHLAAAVVHVHVKRALHVGVAANQDGHRQAKYLKHRVLVVAAKTKAVNTGQANARQTSDNGARTWHVRASAHADSEVQPGDPQEAVPPPHHTAPTDHTCSPGARR